MVLMIYSKFCIACIGWVRYFVSIGNLKFAIGIKYPIQAIQAIQKYFYSLVITNWKFLGLNTTTLSPQTIKLNMRND